MNETWPENYSPEAVKKWTEEIQRASRQDTLQEYQQTADTYSEQYPAFREKFQELFRQRILEYDTRDQSSLEDLSARTKRFYWEELKILEQADPVKYENIVELHEEFSARVDAEHAEFTKNKIAREQRHQRNCEIIREAAVNFKIDRGLGIPPTDPLTR